MIVTKKAFEKYIDYPIAIYGLSNETEKALQKMADYNIIGLLDSFQENGYLYGKKIISLNECLVQNVKLIIVVARPGSCKAIAKRIGDFCKINNILLFDYKGNDLLAPKAPLYTLNKLNLLTKTEVLSLCNDYELISFDLFDTLVMRKVLYSSDIFIRMNEKLHEQNIIIDNFIDKRIAFEKKMSIDYAPTLEEIYTELLCHENISTSLSSIFADWEWQLDYETLTPRYEMIDLINTLSNNNKKICIISDTYYSRQQICYIIGKLGISNIDFNISCEYRTSKTQGLFSHIRKKYNYISQLHIGDDEIADIEYAQKAHITPLHILSAANMFDCLGYMGLQEYTKTYNDRLKIGLIISVLFNNPFLSNNNSTIISINDEKDFGYCITGAIITDFIFWFYNNIKQKCIHNIWFGARDGYLIQKLYQRLVTDDKSVYFLISRISALRSGIFSKKDIEYITDMKYSGSIKNQLRVRFGVDINNEKYNHEKCIDEILKKSVLSRKNFYKYINSLNIDDSNIAFFDFVAKGTSQIFCQKLVKNKMIGLYFLQLPNDSELASNLEVYSFIDKNNQNNSGIYNDYYILEAILTSPQPSIIDFDENGNPIYAAECRSENDIDCVLSIQQGIINYFDDYIKLYDKQDLSIHSNLGEAVLNLVHKIKIENSIIKMNVEDNFFNRTTNITDLI